MIPDNYQTLPGFRTIYSETELRNAIAIVDCFNLNNGNAVTSPISTSGSGDKIIINGVVNKQIKIYSLYFVCSASASITFKAGSQTLSGGMEILSMSTDFTMPMLLPIDTNFIINVDSNINLNGFIIYTLE